MKYKRMTAVLALVFSLLCVAALGVRAYSEVVLSSRYEVYPDPMSTVAEQIEKAGFTPELAAQVRGTVLPKGWLELYVASSSSGQILAATSPELERMSEQDLRDQIMKNPYEASDYSSSVKAPDGREYVVGVMRKQDWLYHNTTTYSTLAAMLAGLLAWLALAAWVYLDARQHGSTAAPGWALLSLLAGPLAMNVWLLVRRREATAAEPAGAPDACPGCGADTVAGASFCVRCGYALRPTCPSCRRPVETDWTHCAACGEPLQ